NTVAATGRDPHTLRDRLRALPGVVDCFDASALRDQLDQLLAINIGMVSFMLVFACILGGTILSTMATLSILERSRELATLRALGMRVGRVALLTTIENAISGVLGVAVGLPIAYQAARRTVALFDSDLLAMPFVWSWPLASLVAIAVVLLLLLAQAPALRTVARLDLAALVRARE
ncbi:MAG TPA: ABC transporter permease, partial [Myxococcota bacterium]